MVLNSDGSLPNDGLGDFDLVAKRGPPRGPRSMKRENGSPPPGWVIEKKGCLFEGENKVKDMGAMEELIINNL